MILDAAHFNGRISRQEIVGIVSSKCYLCGHRMRKITWDHVIPRSKGGRGILNYLPAHSHCNHKKGDAVLSPEKHLISKYYRIAVIAHALGV